MNMQITPTQARLMAEARARRERLFNSPNGRREIKPTPPPIQRGVEKTYDAHVITWQIYKAKGGSPMRAFVETMAESEGLLIKVIMSKSRDRVVVRHRHRYIYELKSAFPEASLTQIGNVFGGLDHTTILHAISCHAARNGLPPLYTLYVPKLKEPKPPKEPKVYVEKQSGIPGVNWETAAQRWVVRFYINGKRTYGGSFIELDDAIARHRKLKGLDDAPPK